MGTFSSTTVASDGGGNSRNSSGSGTTYTPQAVGELSPLTHTLTWTPGPNEQVVTEICDVGGDIADSGISIALNAGECVISGEYTDLFPTEFFEWTTPPADDFSPPDFHTGTEWSDLPAPEDSNLTQFDCHTVQDKSGTYTYTVNWVNTVSLATGSDVLVVNETVYMDFWLHADNATERGV